MSHILEGELALYAAQPEAIADARRAEIEAHLATCGECQEAHDFFAIRDDEFDDALREPDTWEPLVPTPTSESLMEYGARVAEENREAEEILAPFLASPMTIAWTPLTAKRKFVTGGVVRKLIAAAHGIHRSKPRVALTFAEAAISVAEVLSDDLYPDHAIYQLRGASWKECAKAQLLLGQFPPALESLDRAERAYRKTPNNGVGLSLVAMLRSGVFYEQGRLDEAMAMANRAELGFAHAGDEKRRIDAAFLLASIMFEAGRANDALPVFRNIVEHGENAQNIQWIATGSYAAGNCELELRNLGEASLLFHRALVIFREHGPQSERLVTEWGIARVLLHGGKLSEAMRRMRDIAREFEKLGMATCAAQVGLDISEGLLAVNRPKEIVELAQHLFAVFKNAGMLTSALSAIAYMKEAAGANRLTKHDLDAIRAFLRRAERQPSLQFVPPPKAP